MNIQPEDQTVEECLKQRTYYIDFYQREYVWSKDIVKILLDDIFFTFDLAHEEQKDKDLTEEILAKYNWYYLNIYITNNVHGKEYIVDGQQRLTTLTLIIVKLLHLTENEDVIFENLIDPLKQCIFGKDKFKGEVFWIDNKKRKRIMEHILKKKEFLKEYNSVTEENIHKRFDDISKYIDKKKMSREKLYAFVMYFLEKLVLVELKIEKKDTPMVFEVINDRGVSLKPFEILKGVLVGTLDKDDTEKYSKLWEQSIDELRGIEDDFFIDFFKGKYIFKKNSDIEKSINNQYHRYIFESNPIAEDLKVRRKDEHHVNNIKKFIKSDLIYYSRLYAKIRKNESTFLSYNYNINSLSGQYQNIMASCQVNDNNEDDKIETISKEIDRLYVLLHFNGIYNNNNYQEISYQLNGDLQNSDLSEYRKIFNDILRSRIEDTRNLTEIHSFLDYDRFKTRGYDSINRRPLRYFFARVEEYICSNLEEEMKHSVQYISTKTGHKTGYHIEHILSRNDENKQYFTSEDEFENERNRLGGLLLLFNMDNIISNNEKYYSGKRQTYDNGLIWGRTLIDSFYHRTNSRFIDFNQEFKEKGEIEFKEINKFDRNALEYRSKLLYEIVNQIWDINIKPSLNAVVQ